MSLNVASMIDSDFCSVVDVAAAAPVATDYCYSAAALLGDLTKPVSDPFVRGVCPADLSPIFCFT